MQFFNKKIILSVIFCIITVGAILLLNHLLVPWTQVERKYMAFDEQKDNIEFLIIGDSLEEAGFDTTIMSETLRQKVSFMTQAASFPEVHYYMLMDALTKQHHIKTVLLGWAILQNYQVPFYDDKIQLRLEFLKRARGNDEMFNYALLHTLNQRYTDILMRFSLYLDNFNKINDVLRSKQEKKAHLANASLISNTDEKVINEDGTEDDLSQDPAVHKEPRQIRRVTSKRYTPSMRESDKIYLAKIKKLCDEHNIDLMVIASSIPSKMQKEVPILKTCIENSKQIMSELGINYIDTSDETRFPNSCDTYNFRDWVGHYNQWYRPIHTKQVLDYIALQKTHR